MSHECTQSQFDELKQNWISFCMAALESPKPILPTKLLPTLAHLSDLVTVVPVACAAGVPHKGYIALTTTDFADVYAIFDAICKEATSRRTFMGNATLKLTVKAMHNRSSEFYKVCTISWPAKSAAQSDHWSSVLEAAMKNLA